MILGIEKWFVINEFRSKRLCNELTFNTCNQMGKNPFQRNISLYPEIRFKRVRYREARLYDCAVVGLITNAKYRVSSCANSRWSFLRFKGLFYFRTIKL